MTLNQLNKEILINAAFINQDKKDIFIDQIKNFMAE